MAFDHYETIKFDRDGKILTVTLNRPERLNAVSVKMHHELSTAVRGHLRPTRTARSWS